MRRVAAAVATGALVVPFGVPAQLAAAAVPGENGRIVFASQAEWGYEIFTMNSNGTDRVRLTTDLDHASDPLWSPDGTQIAFVSGRSGDYHIHTMSADGTHLRQLTSGESVFHPAWSPDGRTIAFTSNRQGQAQGQTSAGTALYTVNVASGAVSLLIDDNVGYPAWSPDGRMIAFTSFRHGGGYEIYVAGSDGTAVRRLTFGTENHEPASTHPEWSPDGTRIAFVRDFDIWVMNADGTDVTRVPDTKTNGNNPSWSPDGRQIVFDADPAWCCSPEVYVMNADGSDLRQLTRGTDVVLRGTKADSREPSWAAVPSADLAVSLSAAATVVQGRRRVTLTSSVTDLGPSNTHAVAVDLALPQDTSFVSATAPGGSCSAPDTGVADGVTCSLHFLPAQETWTVTVVVEVQKKTTMISSVSVSADTPDHDKSNNTDTVTLDVR